MSAVTDPLVVERPLSRFGNGAVLFAMILAALGLTCLMNAAQTAATFHGHFGDPDDAMRLVEARAWLAGQSWFDMTATRLDPPHGSVMHWSRLVDLPVASIIRLFGLFTDGATAERLALIAVPILWLAALYLGMARLATLLVGRAGRVPALLGMVFSGATLVQFGPGRVGHHAPETVALVFGVGAGLAAFDRNRVREAFVAGALSALSLGMSLETLPFQVVLVGLMVLMWAWHGRGQAAMLAWLGAGLAMTLPVVFFVTVGPDSWFAPICDAYGIAHFGAGLIGAIGILALARFTPRLRTRLLRLTAAFVPVGLAAIYVAVAYPLCLHSPFASVDPLIRMLWLDHVVESLPLPAFLRVYPMIGLAIVGPVVLGLAGSLIAVVFSRGACRMRFALVAALTVFGLALAFWQVRVLGSVTPLALCGGIYVVTLLADRLVSRGLALAGTVMPGAILVFTSTAWIIALPGEARSDEKTDACLSTEALAPLAELPVGTAVAPINSGAHLLEATKLSVFAGPYHRNDDGNRFAFEVFMAAPKEARVMLAARHVDYVITCSGMADLDRLAKRAPDGLAAQLAKGQLPDFLAERRLGPTPYRVFAVTEQGR